MSNYKLSLSFIFAIIILLLLDIICIQCKILTLEDYTLYFDEYHFDWANADDWHVITADNTPSNGLPKGNTKIVACTLNIKGTKKNLCVHTKAEGGFTLKFQDFPHLNSGFDDVKLPNSAHQDIENDFEQFLKSQYDTNDDEDIELDFLNDDDWSEINAIWNWNTNTNTDTNNDNNNNDNQQQENFENMDMNSFKNAYYEQYYQQMNQNDVKDFGAHPQHRRLKESLSTRSMNDDEEELLGKLFRRRS